jgi:hypothetical protein
VEDHSRQGGLQARGGSHKQDDDLVVAVISGETSLVEANSVF